MCVYKITPMHSCTYKMQPIYYIAPYTAFLIATKLNQCYGGNAKPIALPSNYSSVFSTENTDHCRVDGECNVRSAVGSAVLSKTEHWRAAILS